MPSRVLDAPTGRLAAPSAGTQVTSRGSKLRWQPRQARHETRRRRRVAATLSASAVLVCPGFLFSSQQYAELVSDLRAEGFTAEVVQTSLLDWAPVLAGHSFEWYLARLDALLQRLHAQHGRVALVGHSAGGWIARILLGTEPYQGARYGRAAQVHTLLTLGTPHLSTEAYPFGRAKVGARLALGEAGICCIEQSSRHASRELPDVCAPSIKQESLAGPNLADVPPPVRESSLKFANYFYPTAQSLGSDVRVVCACGQAIRGRLPWAQLGSRTSGSPAGAGDAVGRQGSSSWDSYFAFESYKSSVGRGDVDGDGVTPLSIALLPGAEQLVLEGVWHSPRRSPGQLWYGSAAARERWRHYLVDPSAEPTPQ